MFLPYSPVRIPRQSQIVASRMFHMDRKRRLLKFATIFSDQIFQQFPPLHLNLLVLSPNLFHIIHSRVLPSNSHFVKNSLIGAQKVPNAHSFCRLNNPNKNIISDLVLRIYPNCSIPVGLRSPNIECQINWRSASVRLRISHGNAAGTEFGATSQQMDETALGDGKTLVLILSDE